LAVSPFHDITIEPPLRGAGWTGINACCVPNAHRNVRVASGTRIGTAETFAVDYVRVDHNRFYQGDGGTNAQYPYFGAPIYAVAAGTVVALHDGMDESTRSSRQRRCTSLRISAATMSSSAKRKASTLSMPICRRAVSRLRRGRRWRRAR
jgi:hypothetical protein